MSKNGVTFATPDHVMVIKLQGFTAYRQKWQITRVRVEYPRFGTFTTSSGLRINMADGNQILIPITLETNTTTMYGRRVGRLVSLTLTTKLEHIHFVKRGRTSFKGFKNGDSVQISSGGNLYIWTETINDSTYLHLDTTQP